MKICFLVSADSVHTHGWVNYFAKQGWNVDLITWRAPIYSEIHPDVTVHRIFFPPHYIARYCALLEIVWLLRKIRPDIIHAHYLGHFGILAGLYGQEGLKVPKKQPKRKRLWLNDGSCIRLRPEYKDHVWSYDFMIDRTADGRSFKILNIIDEYTRECLAIVVKRSITSQDVIDKLFELFILRGIPEHIRSDNGPEFTATAIRKWLSRIGVKTLFIEPGSPWENGYIESFNGKLRDELLNREILTTLTEAKILIKQWRKEYNHIRPHSSLKYRPPVPEAILVAATT